MPRMKKDPGRAGPAVKTPMKSSGPTTRGAGPATSKTPRFKSTGFGPAEPYVPDVKKGRK